MAPRPRQAPPEPGGGLIRVLIVDDHELIRAGIRLIVNRAPGIVVVGECTDGGQVVQTAADVQPDVVLMDLQMPVMGGVDATRNLLADQPHVKVLVLTGWANGSALKEVARAGAAGWVFKTGDGIPLIHAIRTVAAGGNVWPLSVSTGRG